MAGSPKKRAREKARRLEETAAQAPATLCPPAAGNTPAAPPATTLPVLHGEVIPPAASASTADPTRTALKRAMRAAAQQHAEKALEVLARAMESPDLRVAASAANDILDRAYGKPTPELDPDA